MDKKTLMRIIQSSLFLIICLLSTYQCDAAGPLNSTLIQPLSNLQQVAYITCTIDNNRSWWIGTNIRDPSTFEPIRELCGNGDPSCRVPSDSFKMNSHTFVCCSSSEHDQRLDSAEAVECKEIVVCPHSISFSAPLVVEIGKISEAYVRMTTIPPPDVSPVDLTISIENGGPVINHTVSRASLRTGTDNAPVITFVFQFQVPSEYSARETLRFAPTVKGVPLCITPDPPPPVTGVQLIGPSTGVPSTRATEQPTTMPSTEAASATDNMPQPVSPDQICHHLSLLIGVPFGALILGLLIGMAPLCICHFCSGRKTGDKSSPHRELPPIPDAIYPQDFHKQPPTTLFPTLTPNGIHTATPTPTDHDCEHKRLLAGQTPNNPPPPDNHPLNHIPAYATTNRMSQMRSDHMYTPSIQLYLQSASPLMETSPSNPQLQEVQSPNPNLYSPYAFEGQDMSLSAPVPADEEASV